MRHRTYAWLAGLLMVVAILGGCALAAPTPTPTPLPPTPTPDPNVQEAQALWQTLQQAQYAQNWSTVPGKGTFYKGQGPHGLLLSTYLNEAAFKALQEKPGTMPDGAIIVKENYTPDKTLDSITVMYKKAGYAPDKGDWFWVKYGPQGEVQAAGQPAGCLSCHAAVRSNDYIFTFPIAPLSVTAVEPTDKDKEMARSLWQTLQEARYAQNWTTVPGKGTFYKGQPPHGALLSTYLNDKAAEAMKAKPGEMPDGAIIVKENYTPDKTLDSITVMYKETGYDPEHKDWFWVKFGPQGEIQAAGKPVGCLSCHGSVRSNDYIFTFPVALQQP